MLRSNCLSAVARPLIVTLVALAAMAGMAAAETCDGGTFPSTFALIEKAIFENRGCNNVVCHGEAKAGDLDLRPGVAFDNLVDVDATTVPNFKRVLAGQKERSLFFVNLAAKTDPAQWHAPLRAMPLDPLPALSSNELEAVRLWVEKGAPKDSVVPGTDTLLNACLPPPEPIVVKPLPPPPADKGVQIVMPPWVLTKHTEREVCFVSYFDITDKVPAEFRSPDGKTFRYKFNAIRQTPQSHHLIVNLYTGDQPPESPIWGTFKCVGGSLQGQVCNPVDLQSCGSDGMCATEAVNSIACIGFADAGLGISSAGFTGTQETASEFNFAEGVYRQVPMKGLILWNSHAFNLTDKDATLEAWLNFEFAPPEEQITPALQIFNTDEIFKMNVPAFSTQEVCSLQVMPAGARLYELSSHAHHRMKRWRTFEGAFTCESGANAGQPCSPFGPDFDSSDLCAGAPCTSVVRPKVGDCDGDTNVTIDELVLSVSIGLETLTVDNCADADSNEDQEVSIDEIIVAVSAALNGVPPPTARDPQDSLLYVSLVYNDPVVLRFDPAMVMTGSASQRTLTYCGLYDNGFTDPTDVKTRAGSPQPPFPIPGVGGPCQTPTNCTAGKVGEPCQGSSESRRNQSCDSTQGAGDGKCDACPLRGGVTTQDEMFILLGQYFVP